MHVHMCVFLGNETFSSYVEYKAHSMKADSQAEYFMTRPVNQGCNLINAGDILERLINGNAHLDYVTLL